VAIASIALGIGLTASYAWWGRALQRVQARLGASETSRAPTVEALTSRRPAAIVDLATREGVSLVEGQWRARHTSVMDVSGGAASLDDSRWAALDPSQLQGHATTGTAPLTWYRVSVTIPRALGAFDPTGSTAVLEVVVDGAVQVWVDGRPAQRHAERSPASRAILTRDARPGQRIQLAILGVNLARSGEPSSAAAILSATLDFFPRPKEEPGGVGEVVRLGPGLETIAPLGTRIEKVADRFRAVEGPVWVPEGYLLFSDFAANTIYRWAPEDGVSVFRPKSGYAGLDISEYSLPGSNGLALDLEGRLTIAEHGRRRVVRLDDRGGVTVLVDRYDGRRLNSPNDLVYKSDGALYFTDPPFGLPRRHEDSRRELSFAGIFAWGAGRLRLLDAELGGPNGLAFSPDERYLYVTNWDGTRSAIMRYDVQADGTLASRRTFFKIRADGLKVDRRGNVHAAGPGGVWIISPGGEHLGTLRLPEQPSNLAWGDHDRQTLYITANKGLYRVRLQVTGSGAVSSVQRHVLQ
jgi:gluconolactonase